MSVRGRLGRQERHRLDLGFHGGALCGRRSERERRGEPRPARGDGGALPAGGTCRDPEHRHAPAPAGVQQRFAARRTDDHPHHFRVAAQEEQERRLGAGPLPVLGIGRHAQTADGRRGGHEGQVGADARKPGLDRAGPAGRLVPEHPLRLLLSAPPGGGNAAKPGQPDGEDRRDRQPGEPAGPEREWFHWTRARARVHINSGGVQTYESTADIPSCRQLLVPGGVAHRSDPAAPVRP